MARRAEDGYRSNLCPKSCLLSSGMRVLAACVVQATIASPSLSTSGKPRVFVYELPLSFRDGVPTRDDQRCDELVAGSPDLLDCLFGEEFIVPTDRGPLKLRKTDQFAMGRIFMWRIMSSVVRVAHPSDADLFFVPFWFSDWMPTICPTATEMFSQLYHLDASTAGKHIFLSPRVAHRADVCPFWWGYSMNAVMKFALEDRDCCWWVVGENTHSIPYPGYGSGLDPDMTQRLWMLRDPSRSRPILVMGAFGFHGISKSLRQTLANECNARGPPICRGVVLTMIQETGHPWVPNDKTFNELVIAMLQSRFCFQPMGDTPSRKGIIDSILLGCIPVLFSMNQTRLWPWHIPDLANITVVLDVMQGSPIDQLKAIDEARVTQLRRGVAEAARHLAYTIQDGTDDAVETALFHAWIQAGGRPKETRMLPGTQVPPSPAQLLSTQPSHEMEHHDVPGDGIAKEKPAETTHKVEHHNVPRHGIAKGKPAERWQWSCAWLGFVVFVCSIVNGVGIGFMVLQTGHKSEPASNYFVGKRIPTRSAKHDQQSLLPINREYRM